MKRLQAAIDAARDATIQELQRHSDQLSSSILFLCIQAVRDEAAIETLMVEYLETDLALEAAEAQRDGLTVEALRAKLAALPEVPPDTDIWRHYAQDFAHEWGMSVDEASARLTRSAEREARGEFPPPSARIVTLQRKRGIPIARPHACQRIETSEDGRTLRCYGDHRFHPGCVLLPDEDTEQTAPASTDRTL